jgi:predicted O-methyltransferase YrrM
MRLYEREFSVGQAAKLISVVGVASGPLLFAALRKGPLTAFEFAGRSLEIFKELTEDNPLPEIALEGIGATNHHGSQIWIDLNKPSPSMPPGELAILCALVKWKDPRTLVEIGTYKGFTTLHLSRNTNENCRIFTADLPPETADQKAAESSDPHLIKEAAKSDRAFGNDAKIVQILQDSTTVDWAKIVGSPVEFALIDGSHLYEHIRQDTEGILKVLAPGGIVVWHDYMRVEIRRGVGKYLVNLRRSGLPVYRIVGTTLAVYVSPV